MYSFTEMRSYTLRAICSFFIHIKNYILQIDNIRPFTYIYANAYTYEYIQTSRLAF